MTTQMHVTHVYSMAIPAMWNVHCGVSLSSALNPQGGWVS